MSITQYDFIIPNFIQEHFRFKFLDIIMPFITYLGDFGFIWLLIGIIFFLFPKTRKLGIFMLLSIAVSFLIYQCILKPIVARPRPFTQNPNITLLIKPPKDFSFPSGHTACAFSAVIVLFLEKNKLWIPAAILAFLIAFSRLYLYVHFPSDVLAGFFCGNLFGGITYFIIKKIITRKNIWIK